MANEQGHSSHQREVPYSGNILQGQELTPSETGSIIDEFLAEQGMLFDNTSMDSLNADTVENILLGLEQVQAPPQNGSIIERFLAEHRATSTVNADHLSADMVENPTGSLSGPEKVEAPSQPSSIIERFLAEHRGTSAVNSDHLSADMVENPAGSLSGSEQVQAPPQNGSIIERFLAEHRAKSATNCVTADTVEKPAGSLSGPEQVLAPPQNGSLTDRFLAEHGVPCTTNMDCLTDDTVENPAGSLSGPEQVVEPVPSNFRQVKLQANPQEIETRKTTFTQTEPAPGPVPSNAPFSTPVNNGNVSAPIGTPTTWDFVVTCPNQLCVTRNVTLQNSLCLSQQLNSQLEAFGVEIKRLQAELVGEKNERQDVQKKYDYVNAAYQELLATMKDQQTATSSAGNSKDIHQSNQPPEQNSVKVLLAPTPNPATGVNSSESDQSNASRDQSGDTTVQMLPPSSSNSGSGASPESSLSEGYQPSSTPEQSSDSRAEPGSNSTKEAESPESSTPQSSTECEKNAQNQVIEISSEGEEASQPIPAPKGRGRRRPRKQRVLAPKTRTRATSTLGTQQRSASGNVNIRKRKRKSSRKPSYSTLRRSTRPTSTPKLFIAEFQNRKKLPRYSLRSQEEKQDD